jgi:hypothetical protein
MVLEVTQNFLLRDIAVTHFKSKSINVDLDEYCFKIPGYDFFLDLEQSINDLLEVAWVFQDREQDDVVATIVLIRKVEKGDSLQRETLTIDPAQEASLCVWAFKRGGSTGGILSGFKKRYFVLQSNTLYYSESPGSPVLGYIPMSGISSKIRTDIQYKDKIAFELTTTSSNSRSYVLCADQLEFSQLHQALDDIQLRRVKAAVVTLCQELIRRDVSNMQGLFRISGEKYQVEALKHQYDLALDPELDDHPSEVLAGVVKQYLRSLESPLIGFGLYNEYLRFGKMQPGPDRTEAIITGVKRLPQSTRYFLFYLCLVLKLVSSHASTNLMNTKNLAIVIGPNLLRPQRETTQSAMNDNQFVLAATQALIDEVDVVFGPSLTLKVPDTQSTTEHAQLRQRAASVSVGYGAGNRPPMTSSQQNRQSRYSISEIDPSLTFVQDLKSAMQTSKTVGGKIQDLNEKHAAVMTKWNDLIRAIKANPHSTMNLSEFILNQSEIDTRWIDQGLSSLDQVFANLSELVDLLSPEQHHQQQHHQQQQQYQQQQYPNFSPPLSQPSSPINAQPIPPPPSTPKPPSSASYQSFQYPLPNVPGGTKAPPPPPPNKPHSIAYSTDSEHSDIPPPPPPDF